MDAPGSEEESMQPLRQGDVILLATQQVEGKKLPHLTLAKGEVTGHTHRISDGQAELYEQNRNLILRVISETALLTHEEHKAISMVVLQKLSEDKSSSSIPSIPSRFALAY